MEENYDLTLAARLFDSDPEVKCQLDKPNSTLVLRVNNSTKAHAIETLVHTPKWAAYGTSRIIVIDEGKTDYARLICEAFEGNPIFDHVEVQYYTGGGKKTWCNFMDDVVTDSAGKKEFIENVAREVLEAPDVFYSTTPRREEGPITKSYYEEN